MTHIEEESHNTAPGDSTLLTVQQPFDNGYVNFQHPDDFRWRFPFLPLGKEGEFAERDSPHPIPLRKLLIEFLQILGAQIAKLRLNHEWIGVFFSEITRQLIKINLTHIEKENAIA